MDKIIAILKERISLLRKAKNKAVKEQKAFPKGRLRSTRIKNKIRYYYLEEKGDTIGRYLNKGDNKLLRKLAQKSYDERFVKVTSKEISKLEKLVNYLEKNNANLAYTNLKPDRKSLVNPHIVDDELYAKEWQNQKIPINNYLNENKIYETRRGDMVRSKSEAIIADILLDLEIPYFYEKPLKLKSGYVKYPDFTILKKQKREEIYLEHFGLLDDEEYLISNLSKLDEYRTNGIYIGKNLIFTYESQNNPLDISGIRKMLKEVLKD